MLFGHRAAAARFASAALLPALLLFMIASPNPGSAQGSHPPDRLRPDARAAQAQRAGISAANQLVLPTGVPSGSFAPTVNTQYSPADATSTTLPGLLLHGGLPNGGQSYVALGARGAWYQEFGRRLPDGAIFYLLYLGSFYSGPEAAQAAFQSDMGVHTATVTGSTVGAFTVSVTSSSCAHSVGSACLDLTVQGLPLTVGGSVREYTAVLRVVRVLNALFEGGYMLPSSDLDTNRAEGDAALSAMAGAWITLFAALPVPTPGPNPPPGSGPPPPTLPAAPPSPTTGPTATPVPAVFALMTVRFEGGSRAAFASAGLKQARAGKTVHLVAYVQVAGGPPGAAVTVRVSLARGHTVVVHRTFHHHLLTGQPAGLYAWGARITLPKRTGVYHGTIAVEIGGQIRTGQARLRVVKR